MSRNGPELEHYWTTLSRAIPDFPPEQQKVAVAIYRELSQGEPVSGEQVAEAIGLAREKGPELLSLEPLHFFLYPDEQGRVVGFGGLAVAPMHHELRVRGRKLWTWCAWDTLFLPEVLGQPAEVSSPDPETGDRVRLRVSPGRIESAEPESALVSFLLPGADDFDSSAANVMAKFCHFVFFFASEESAERWTSKHEGTFLYTLDDAQELARRLTAKQFGAELRRRCSAA